QKIFLKTLLDRLIRQDGTIQLHKLRKGKGVDDKLHIASAQIGRQFTGQQLRVGAGDVDVAVQGDAEGVDALLPVLHFLNFIEEQIDLAADLSSPFENLIMESFRSLQMGIPHILKVDGYELRRTNAGACKLLLDQFQHN